MCCLSLSHCRPANCDSLMVCKSLSVSRGMLATSEFCEPMYFGVLLFDPFAIFFDNFYSAFFRKRLVRNDGLDFVCLNSFLRCGQVTSVFCILLRSSMNLMIHLPRILYICKHFCFAGIVVKHIKNCEESVCLPSVRVCTHTPSNSSSPCTFFTFFSFCYQSSFCNGVMISCSIHGVDELYSCKESSVEQLFFLIVFGSHECRSIFHLHLHWFYTLFSKLLR